MMAALARNVTRGNKTEKQSLPRISVPVFDYWLLAVTVFLLGLGLVMVLSSSISIADRQLDQPLYYFYRQIIFVIAGLVVAAVISQIRMGFWEKSGGVLLIVSLLLLLAVLVPGVGKEVNGSARWLPLGIINLQPSELVKLFVLIYLAGYLVRRCDEMHTAIGGFIKPMAVLAVFSVLLLAEPDFGAAAIMLATAMGMMFLGGVRIWQFGVLVLFVLLAFVALALSSPYRLQRITAFMDPWADPFASGFQLTQALIAFGRGEWFGVGLGGSIQKLFYLPEAHTDFLFAVTAEELGLAGSLVIICAFVFILYRAFMIGRRAERSDKLFAAYLAYGLGMWMGLQAFTNIAVNMGVFPTKGLTLPFMSYGGSSIVVMCVVMALLLRVDYEARLSNKRKPNKTKKLRASKW